MSDYAFPSGTLMLTILEACQEVRKLVGHDADKAAFLMDIKRSKIIEPVNTELLGYPNMLFKHFKTLPVNELYKLFDEKYSQVGLRIVTEGKDGIENCSFNAIQPIDTGPFCTTKEDQMLVRRTSWLRKIKDGDREFDALLILYLRLQAYKGRPIEFLPEFRKENGSIWKEGTQQLRTNAWFQIINHKNFPIKGTSLEICELKAAGRTDEFIMEFLKISKPQLQDYLKNMKKKNSEHFFARSSYYDIIQFFKNCKLI